MRGKFIFLSILLYGIIAISLTQCNSEEKITELTHSWEIAVPNQEVPEGLASLSAADCGACHVKHYEEWQMSTHAHAWTDLQFQAELKKESSPIMCINCHIPLQNQQEYIVKGLINGDIYQPVKEKNPAFDPKLQQEGINCASCHVRNNVVIGPTGTSKAPHKTVKNTEHLSEKLCISCHNATAVITPTLACTFETGDEWKAGPYADDKTCISCHMEATEREIVAGFGKRESHFHGFPGSGIPKFDSVKTNVLNGLKISTSDLKKHYALNDSIKFSLTVKNEFAGHKVPTGDPERYFLIHLELKNEDGIILTSRTERIGEEWEWYPEAKKISDNNLLPKEERTYDFYYLPETEDHLILTARITKHRLNEKNAEYNKLSEHYPLFISIFEESFDLMVSGEN